MEACVLNTSVVFALWLLFLNPNPNLSRALNPKAAENYTTWVVGEERPTEAPTISADIQIFVASHSVDEIASAMEYISPEMRAKVMSHIRA